MSPNEDPIPWKTLRVQRRSALTPDIVEFELRHPEALPLPGFTPGAHVRVQTPGLARSRDRTRPAIWPASPTRGE